MSALKIKLTVDNVQPFAMALVNCFLSTVNSLKKHGSINSIWDAA
jgi:hypothetical protein